MGGREGEGAEEGEEILRQRGGRGVGGNKEAERWVGGPAPPAAKNKAATSNETWQLGPRFQCAHFVKGGLQTVVV